MAAAPTVAPPAPAAARRRPASREKSRPPTAPATAPCGGKDPCADPAAEAAEIARSAGLRYVSDTMPGIRRQARGDTFTYATDKGEPITDPDEVQRIKRLAIPPAWTDVWICPRPNGHLQATGRDARGRKQYRYHSRWREVRDDAKYGRLLAFGEMLPQIRARTAQDLGLPGVPRARVLAAVVAFLEATLIRVGNEEYARTNDSFGLTTIRNEHVEVNGTEIRFDFRGKSGKVHSIATRDRRLANIVRRCQDLPGQDLFGYIDDDGNHQDVTSGDVNDYLREITGQDFTAKDFRTWSGTVLAAATLRDMDTAETEAAARRNIVEAVKIVAHRLGNTPAVCRKCYVHPAVFQAYAAGDLPGYFADATGGELAADESAVISLLRSVS